MSISIQRRTSNLNPMSAIDIKALEEAMRAQQLDQLRGYRKDTYGEVKQNREPVYVSEAAEADAVGQQVLSEPMFNKGKQSQIDNLSPAPAHSNADPSLQALVLHQKIASTRV